MKKQVLGFAIAVLFALALGGCASDGNSTVGSRIGSGQEIATIDRGDLSGGVAAIVGDVEIGENAITAYVNNFRYAQGLQDDELWGQWLYDNAYSADALRRDTVEMFVSQELIRQGAQQEGISVSDDEVNETIDEARGDATDEEYADSLASQGLTEDYYRETVRIGLLREKLAAKVNSGGGVDDETLLEYLKMYYPDEVPDDATNLDG